MTITTTKRATVEEMVRVIERKKQMRLKLDAICEHPKEFKAVEDFVNFVFDKVRPAQEGGSPS